MLVPAMLLLLSSATTFNELSDSLHQQDYNYYMQKSKSQKNAANILIITGVVVLTVTALLVLASGLGEIATTIVTLGASKPEHHSYTVPLLLSLAAIIGGIVLYSAASRNKKIAKGISLGVGMGSSPVLQRQTVKNYTYPSLSLKIIL